MINDTIVALATPPGRSGIGVVRLSGSAALSIAATLSRRQPETFAPNHTFLTRIFAPVTDEEIDEVLLTYFKAPRSFTGEDVIELSGHGNPLILGQIVKYASALGARPAGPGEFSMRAFLKGKLDLSQAEALSDLINAQTQYQLKTARTQLGGSLALCLKPLKEELLNLIVQLETALEFVEDDVSTERLESINQRMGGLIRQFDELLGSYDLGRIVREGLKIGLVGRPNVGKSSIFNRLLKYDRAIVTDIPGTTRDVLAEGFELAGILVTLFDTAGIRESENIVEHLGIERSKAVLAEADLILLVLDLSRPLETDDLKLVDSCAELEHLIVINKGDLPPAWSISDYLWLTPDALIVSAQTSANFAQFWQILTSKVTNLLHLDGSDPIVTNARHHRLLDSARSNLTESRNALTLGLSEEVALVGLHAALRDLGELTGETIIDDILNQIFGTFCIGK